MFYLSAPEVKKLMEISSLSNVHNLELVTAAMEPGKIRGPVSEYDHSANWLYALIHRMSMDLIKVEGDSSFQMAEINRYRSLIYDQDARIRYLEDKLRNIDNMLMSYSNMSYTSSHPINR